MRNRLILPGSIVPISGKITRVYKQTGPGPSPTCEFTGGHGKGYLLLVHWWLKLLDAEMPPIRIPWQGERQAFLKRPGSLALEHPPNRSQQILRALSGRPGE